MGLICRNTETNRKVPTSQSHDNMYTQTMYILLLQDETCCFCYNTAGGPSLLIQQ